MPKVGDGKGLNSPPEKTPQESVAGSAHEEEKGTKWIDPQGPTKPGKMKGGS